MSETVEKRVFIGGLGKSVTKEEVLGRLKDICINISNVNFSSDKMENHEHGGFLHADIKSNITSWTNFISSYNGTRWKEGKLRIEDAKPDYRERYSNEIQKSPTSLQKRKRHLIRHAANMCLVTDDNVEQRKGWKRGKYGRALCQVKMKNAENQIVTIDPAHYKDRYVKLFGSVKPKAIDQLQFYNETDMYSKDYNIGASSDSSIEATAKSDLEQEQPLCPPASPETFSLSKLLGLESVQVTDLENNIPVISSATEHENLIEPVSEQMRLKVGDVLLDTSLLVSKYKFKDYAFYRRAGKDEVFLLWQEQRQRLRENFKQKIKQARKLENRRKTKK